MLFDVIITVEAAIGESSVVATIEKICYLFGCDHTVVTAKAVTKVEIRYIGCMLEQATEVLKQFGRLPFYKTATVNEVRSYAVPSANRDQG